MMKTAKINYLKPLRLSCLVFFILFQSCHAQDNKTEKNIEDIQKSAAPKSENISYTGFNSLELTGVTRGVNGTTAATHADGAAITNFVNQATEILECSYRNNSNVDSPLEKINRSQFQALSNKTATGQPSQYFVQRFIDHVLITIYLTPSSTQNGDVINFYYEKRIQDAGAYSNATDVPYRFVPCMVAGLSYYLAMKYAQPRIQELKLIYEDELARALEEDGSSASVYISPKTYFPSI
mgnify:CR=1 FL=1